LESKHEPIAANPPVKKFPVAELVQAQECQKTVPVPETSTRKQYQEPSSNELRTKSKALAVTGLSDATAGENGLKEVIVYSGNSALSAEVDVCVLHLELADERSARAQDRASLCQLGQELFEERIKSAEHKAAADRLSLEVLTLQKELAHAHVCLQARETDSKAANELCASRITRAQNPTGSAADISECDPQEAQIVSTLQMSLARIHQLMNALKREQDINGALNHQVQMLIASLPTQQSLLVPLHILANL